jgi:hypothetical protein
VFDGLTANRRSCVVCGYTEAVMLFSFDNWQLAVPRLVSNITSRHSFASLNAFFQASCTIYDCLRDYTRLERLTDCICRKCSMVATHQKLLTEAERAAALVTIESNPSSSKRKYARDVRKLEARVRAAIKEGRIEEDIPGVQLEKVYSRESTKQVMVARVSTLPPLMFWVLTSQTRPHLSSHYISTAPFTSDTTPPRTHVEWSFLRFSTFRRLLPQVNCLQNRISPSPLLTSCIN